MFRRIACGILLCATVALAGACGSTTLPVAPTGGPFTETFIGTLIPASANLHAFVSLTGGPVTATLTAVGPDATQTVGFSLGTYNATLNVCTAVLDNPAALQAFALNATASTIGTYCVRIYDNGNVATAVAAGTTDSFSYTITVVHP
jgi:hypothetical protein